MQTDAATTTLDASGNTQVSLTGLQLNDKKTIVAKVRRKRSTQGQHILQMNCMVHI